MSSPIDTLVFVPVFNQEREFPTVLDEIKNANVPGVDYLLVDNGSTDRSSALIETSGLPFVRLDRNLGVGGAYRVAIATRETSRTLRFSVESPPTGRCSRASCPGYLSQLDLE